MRVWNLSTLSDLEPIVVGTFREKPPSRARISGSSRMKTSLTVAAAAIAISSIVALRSPRLSTTSLALVSDPGGLVQSVSRIAPPLESLFAGRFSGSWSRDQERESLEAMAATKRGSEYDERELVDVALANQQESFDSDVPRLAPDKVARILKKRSR